MKIYSLLTVKPRSFSEQIPLDSWPEGSVNVRLEVSMPNPIAKRLAALPRLDRATLRDSWEDLFGSSPPSELRRDLMIPIQAYRMQEQAFGSLSSPVRTRLRQLGEAFVKDRSFAIASAPKIKAGTRLVRQWRDEVHLVNVKSNGYEYKGGHYKSLSQIARLITGTRWSGPLFFGINSNQPNSKLKEAK
jgi:hypothetical protein